MNRPTDPTQPAIILSYKFQSEILANNYNIISFVDFQQKHMLIFYS